MLVACAVSAIALSACSSASEEARTAPAAPPATDVSMTTSVRSLSNTYHANWVTGAQLFAGTVGQQVTVLSDEGDSQRQLSQIKSLGAAGKVFALNVDPNTAADTEAIVRTVTDAGGYVVTQWSKPEGLNPWDVGNNWVAHISFDGRVSGKQVAKALFDKIGGQGGVVALQGILDNSGGQLRFQGLQAALAEAPGIKLLDDQTANFSRTEALAVTKTLLAKHRGEVKGIWAANDEMALGALAALRAEGLEGQIPIVGFDATPQALEEIKKGASGFVATVSSDAFWQGGAGLSLAYQAATGKIDVSKLSHEQRSFYGTQTLVTAENADKFLAPPTLADLQADFDDPFARLDAPIE